MLYTPALHGHQYEVAAALLSATKRRLSVEAAHELQLQPPEGEPASPPFTVPAGALWVTPLAELWATELPSLIEQLAEEKVDTDLHEVMSVMVKVRW